jgi:hypothetical protein
MSKIVELKAGEIQNVVGGVGSNVMVSTAMAAPIKPANMGNQLNASTVNAQLFQMPSISSNLLVARR